MKKITVIDTKHAYENIIHWEGKDMAIFKPIVALMVAIFLILSAGMAFGGNEIIYEFDTPDGQEVKFKLTSKGKFFN